MALTTIVLPCRNELYLNQTIDGIFAAASGEIEVIIYLDACWNQPLPADRPNLTIVHSSARRGMRAAINTAAEIGKGKYLLKCDAHCEFDYGFDEVLQQEIDDDWVVNPRRYSLDAETWTRKPERERPAVDYEWLSYPYDENGQEVGLHAQYRWKERDRARAAYEVDENLTWQGSCWIMPMRYFRELIYPMSSEGYGNFIGEPQQIGLSVWLSGGKNMLNKRCSYSHLHKGNLYRQLHMERLGFPYTRIGQKELVSGNKYSTDFWFNDRWEQRKHNLAWLIDKFAPVPGWDKWLEDQRNRGLVK